VSDEEISLLAEPPPEGLPDLPTETRDEIVARHSRARPLWREPTLWVSLGFGVLAWLLVVAWVAGQVGHANQRARQNAAGLAQANEKLKSLGVPQVSTPAPVPLPTVTVTVPPIPPSQTQVNQALALYCTLHGCAVPPTATQVAEAVATYCDRHGKCLGPRGPTGSRGLTGPAGPAGPSGANGSAGPVGPTGTPGDNATPDQVALAVADYCAAHDGCQGEPGPTGATGPTGPTGETGPPGAGLGGFTFTVPSLAGGDVTFNCQPDTQPDPGTAPHYHCTRQP
jgi:hypothetical protein